MTSPIRPQNARKLVEALIDRAYARDVTGLIRALTGLGGAGTALEKRLKALERKAILLENAGRRLRPDDPAVKRLLSELDDTLRAQRGNLNQTAQQVFLHTERAAAKLAKELTLPQGVNIAWNTPDPQAVLQVIDYTALPQWKGFIRGFSEGVVEQIRLRVIADFAAGRGAKVAARNLRQIVTDLPAASANRMMRTLQMTAWRDATAVHYAANAHILEYSIRICTFDTRVCPACLALHGTIIPLGERVDDHHNGRCTSIGVIKGTTRNIPSGESWLHTQPLKIQQEILGKAGQQAWQAGKVRLEDYVSSYTDPVFGEMLRSVPLHTALSK